MGCEIDWIDWIDHGGREDSRTRGREDMKKQESIAIKAARAMDSCCNVLVWSVHNEAKNNSKSQGEN
jgi:hypothetical protein